MNKITSFVSDSSRSRKFIVLDFYIRFFRMLTIETNGVRQGKARAAWLYRKCGYLAVNPSQNSPPQLCNGYEVGLWQMTDGLPENPMI
jgi:hypothetical protein